MLKKIVTALKGIVQYFITDYNVKMKGSLTFNSYEWPRWNLSQQYQHNIKQTSDKNKKRYQLPTSPNYNIIKIVQQSFSKENYSLHLGNEWVYSKKFISQHLMINQFSRSSCWYSSPCVDKFLHSHDTSHFCGNWIECEARFIVNYISRS